MSRPHSVWLGWLVLLGTWPSTMSAQQAPPRRPPPSAAAAIQELEALGAEVRVDGDKPDQPVWSVDLSEKPVTRDTLLLLRAFPQLETLLLNDTAVDDRLVEVIVENDGLKELGLAGTHITDQGVARVAVLRSLEKLTLDRTTVTERGLLMLAGLPNLDVPSVFDTRIDEAALSRWAETHRQRQMAAGKPTGTERPGPSPTDSPAMATSLDLYALGRQAIVTARSPAARRAAVAVLEQALEIDPDNDNLRTDLADSYALLGEELCLVAAVDLYEDLLTRNPESDRLWARAAAVYAALENGEDAYRCAGARWSRADTPAKRFVVARQHVTIAGLTDETEAAELFLRQAVVEHGDEPGLRLLWGVVALARDRQAAEQIWQPILEAYPPPHPYGQQVLQMLKQPGAAP